MTVAQLVQKLKCFPEDSEVHFSYNYGDHWRTQVAPKVKTVQELPVEYSEYHRMPRIADDESGAALVVVLES
jgi:hypothetical protein